jgi:hypothetical protein
MNIYTYILLIFLVIILLLIIYNYFFINKYIPYDENKLINMNNENPLYMFVPLNKLTFSQSYISYKMKNDEELQSYSKRIKENYIKTNKISFLNRDPPRGIVWKKNNTIQLLDNRRAVAAIKIFCPDCKYTDELPNNIFIPIRIYNPDTKLDPRLQIKYKPTICFKSQSFCNSIGKFNKPNTYGEAVIYRSINSYDNYHVNSITNKIPIIEKN